MSEERCHHCEYMDLVRFVETHGIAITLSNPNPTLPDGWESHGDAEVIRRCPAHGGQHRITSGRTLKAWIDYEPAARCLKCGSRVTVKVMDGQRPRGHDDNVRYQEICLMGVGNCEKCEIVGVGNIVRLS